MGRGAWVRVWVSNWGRVEARLGEGAGVGEGCLDRKVGAREKEEEEEEELPPG